MGNHSTVPQKTILCVDDEQQVLAALKRVLRSFPCTVVGALDGVEGLAAVETHKPDLIILDARMPRMDGYEFMKHLRKNLKLDIPVVMLTADNTNAGVLKGYSEGAECYITKPFKNEYILDAVNLFIGDITENERDEIEMRLAGIP